MGCELTAIYRNGTAHSPTRLPASASPDLARDIITNGKNTHVPDSIHPHLLTRKTEMQVVTHIWGET